MSVMVQSESRQERRRRKQKERRRDWFNNRASKCRRCGGLETWCSCCEVMSCRGECNDGYGTCMCS